MYTTPRASKFYEECPKPIALKNITELARKASDYAKQQENYYFANNKSLRGFVYTESNPFGQ
jgi:hypothetical protein